MPGILQGFYGPFPQSMSAQDVDSSGQPYYGEAPRGSSRNAKRWSIFMTSYLTTAGAQGASITQFPVDPGTGFGSDQPIFQMAHATDGTYAYASLGVTAAMSP